MRKDSERFAVRHGTIEDRCRDVVFDTRVDNIAEVLYIASDEDGDSFPNSKCCVGPMDWIPIDSVGTQYPNEMIAGRVHVAVFCVLA